MPSLLASVRAAASRLSPHEVLERAEQPLAIALVASSNSGYADMEDFLARPDTPPERRLELLKILHRDGDAGSPERFDLVLYEQGMPCPINAFTFYREDPARTVIDILKERHELALPLARRFTVFRKPVVDRVIHSVARENALFALATALPNVVPSLLELPWAVGEFASDTAFLTINQVRMAFLIGAASDRDVGYVEQKGQIATIIGSAFGWRTLARELVGKIPLGGGLIPKGAIAYAGTYVVGKGLERINRFGGNYTSRERREHFDSAFERGRAVAEVFLAALKNRNAHSQPRP
jgi:hypothetical protein